MKKHKAPYFFIAPAVTLLVIFSIIPIMLALFISFTDMSLAGLADYSRIHFVGLENYINIFTIWTSRFKYRVLCCHRGTACYWYFISTSNHDQCR